MKWGIVSFICITIILIVGDLQYLYGEQATWSGFFCGWVLVWVVAGEKLLSLWGEK